jgi:mRNA interferase HigB
MRSSYSQNGIGGVIILRIIARSTLRDFWQKYPDSEQSLRAWFYDVSRASWQNPSDIKNVYANASIIANNRVVFNIKGNHYRLIVHVRYDLGIIFIRFIGNHQDYDKVDAATI